MKHQHAEQIHAFADGKAIQCRKRIKCGTPPPWEDIAKPSWLEDFEYRVKQEPLATWMDKTMLIKVGQLTQANYDLRDEIEQLGEENTRLRQGLEDAKISYGNKVTDYLRVRTENEHLKKQNEHLQWGHDTAQAVAERRKQEIDHIQHRLDRCMMDKQSIIAFAEKNGHFKVSPCTQAPQDEAEASADADAQVFGADVIISIQFPPMEKL